MLVVTVQNMSNLAEKSNYHFEVWVTTVAGKKKLIAVGDIEEHMRSDGWRKLIHRVCDESVDMG